MNISPNFTLTELVKSQTALRRGIVNRPSEAKIVALRKLTLNILQPVRDHFGLPVHVSSGYRCAALCDAIGSTSTSQHTLGQAADFEIVDVANPAVAEFIRDNLDFDQLILEYYDPEEGPHSGWVHCSYVGAGQNRRQCMTVNRSATLEGLLVPG